MKYYLRSSDPTPLTNHKRDFQEVTYDEYMAAQRAAGYTDITPKPLFVNGNITGKAVNIETIRKDEIQINR